MTRAGAAVVPALARLSAGAGPRSIGSATSSTPIRWNTPAHRVLMLARPKGAIELKNITFRYRPGSAEVLKNVPAGYRTRGSHRHRWRVGLGQIDAHQAGAAALQPRRRPGDARRHGCGGTPDLGRLARPDRRGNAGEPRRSTAVFTTTCRLRARPGRRRARSRLIGHRAPRWRRRVHRAAATGLRHDD